MHLRLSGHSLDMTQGTIGPILLQFSLPLLFGSMFQLLYNTVDSMVVGNFVGKEALAAVSATTQICNTLVKLFNGTSIGAGAVISRDFGARDQEKLRKAIHTTMALTLAACVFLTFLGLLSTDWMLRRTSTRAEIFREASLYLHIYFAGVSGLLIYNMGSAILRALGDTRRPLAFLVVSSVLNVVLDLLFVIVFQWGIMGVALATVLAQFVSAGLVIWNLMFALDVCPFSWREVRIDGGTAARILRMGLPIGLQQAIISFSNVFVQAYINVFDTACIAAWGCYFKLDQYMMLPIQSMGDAATTFVAQNLGARQLDRAKKGIWIAFSMAFGISVLTAIVLCAFAPQLVGAFIPDGAVIEYGKKFIWLCTPVAVLCCFNQCLSGALRGAGRSQVPMIITLCTHVLFRQIYLAIATRVVPGNVYVIAFGYPAGWILCAIVIVACYRFSRWDSEYAVRWEQK